MIFNKTVSAPAKINLFLEVNDLRPDGYHNITSVMQTVSLYDKIHIELIKGAGIEVLVKDMPDISGSNNIAYKAAELFLNKVKVKKYGANISIEKSIPLLSGLGGGSSDAAAVLVGLNQMFENVLETQELINIGKQIGADVPFCIVQGTALISGIGENIKSCPQIPPCYIVIVKDGKKESTKAMYKKMDGVENRKIYTEEKILNALNEQKIEEIATSLYNAFSRVSVQNNDIIQCFVRSGALGYCMSGSGPSLFGIFEGIASAQMAIDFFERKGIEAFLVMPV